VLRAHPLLKHPVAWHLFNFLFIAGYQHFLLFLIATPAYVAYTRKGEPLNWGDAIAIVWCIVSLALETTADQQQWSFQEAKHGRRPKQAEAEGDYKRGFLTRGLFRFSRHPNFFGEQCVWWAFFVFSAAALGPERGDSWVNWTLIGCVLLSLLFQGSTPFTEGITLKKYPLYAEYQRVTSALLPLPRFGTPSWEAGGEALLDEVDNNSKY
jgi:steroid 5-alpha reductase family enzyme